MALILAIEPPSSSSRTRSPLPADLSGHDLVRASSIDEALAIIAERAPDLIVFPLALSRKKEAELATRARRPDGHHLDALVLPLRAAFDTHEHDGSDAADPRWFFWKRPTTGPLAAERCDSVALASAIRARYQPPAPPVVARPEPVPAAQREDPAQRNAQREDPALAGLTESADTRAEARSSRNESSDYLAERDNPAKAGSSRKKQGPSAAARLAATGSKAFASAGAISARAARAGGAGTLKVAKLAGAGGVRLAKVAGAGGWHAAKVAGAGSLRALKSMRAGASKAATTVGEIPASMRSSERPVANRESMPAEERIQVGRSRVRKYTAAAALLIFVLPAGIAWRSEILTFASGLGGGGVVEPEAPAEGVVVEPPKPVGRLEVTSNQEVAAVIMGGKVRGQTPLTIDDLEPGTYRVTIESAAGSVTKSVVVKADETTTLDGAVYPGWLALFAPFELQVVERGKRLTLDEQNRVMLSPGRHELELVNLDLGYRDKKVVDVTPGETVAVSVGPARTTLSVTTNPPADVWIDGVAAGQAPVAGRSIDVGVHEILVRHPELGEHRRTVTATTQPLQVTLDLTQPEP